MSRNFISEFAETLLERYAGDLSGIVVMFPSLRARTFFNEAVSNIVNHPVWQPSWATIDELMERGANLVRGERIRLISELYKVYIKYHPMEDLDKFYFWGDMLISDFDMIDKYLIDADQLLRNITDIKEIEADVSYLTSEQEQLIKSFWSSIGSELSLTEQKQRFLEVWRSLPAIYHEYREQLFKLGIGYPGMIYRATAEKIKRGESIPIEDKHYVIAGFNALSKSEEILFSYLAKSGKGAEFFWDYDNYYVDNKEHEAGLFIRNNLSLFPETTPLSHDSFDSIDKSITATACVSNIVQVKHVANIISSIPRDELDKQTAIVLTDENLLIPLLHSLPDEVESVNITMGYPIKTTLAYSFLERIISLHAHSHIKGDETRFYHDDITGLLTHPYIINSCPKAKKIAADIIANKLIMVDSAIFNNTEILDKIFIGVSENSIKYSKYLIDVMSRVLGVITDVAQQEYMRLIIDAIRKVTHSIANCELEISKEIFVSLLRRHIQTLTLPYEGEPIEGVQIMGILETRNIDFKNVIILSMTDATFPGDRTDKPSFIPYGLRLAYGMPTHSEHEAMYAYYFYRLIQRAERVDLLYCSRADYKSTGERSRYISQLEYESRYNIAKHSVGVDLGIVDAQPIVIEKSAKIMSSLQRFLSSNSSSSLSPTALFKYLECPLKFYLSTIAHLKTPDELEDTIDPLTLGNILHGAMEELYGDICGKENPHAMIEQKRNRDVVEPAVDRAICKELRLKDGADSVDFSGDTLLVRDIITKYIINGVMRYDLSRKDFTVESLECEDILLRYPISNNRVVNLSGRADRIDRLSNGSMQVIDYKSSKRAHLTYQGVEALFNGDSSAKVSNAFQILYYAMLLHRIHSVDVVPSLYYASQMLSKEYSPLITTDPKDKKGCVESYAAIKDEFERELTSALDRLFDPNEPFTQVEDVNACKMCDFKKICRR